MHRLPKRMHKIPNVAIVGAGMAGLRCADVLIRTGVNVTLFEARDRFGGRVHQIESAKRLMDLGPNWIHGTDGNPIMKIAKKTKTILDEMPASEDRLALYDSDGKRRTDDEATDIFERVWGTIAEALKYSDEHSEEIDSQKSLLDYFRDKIAKQEPDREKASDILKTAEMWGSFIGDPISRQSLKFFWLEQFLDGPNPFVAGTYKNILTEVAGMAKTKATVCLNSEIVYFDVAESSPGNVNTITLTTKEGIKYASFDDVVVTCPLGWLKANLRTAFPQSLFPERLTAAIHNIGYGRLEKVYVSFPSAYWLRDTTSTSATSQLSTESYPRFTYFLTPNYCADPSSVLGIQSFISLAHLPELTAHPTLLFYLHGPCATAVIKSITGLAPDSDEYSKVLDDFTSPFYSRLPNYSPADPVCKPSAFLATQWQNDPLAGNGSYTNFPIGLEEADKDIKCMRDSGGLGQKVGLWLAGEHTAPLVALGTTTGAYWSGEGVARRICEKWGIDVVEDEDDSVGETGQRTE